MAYGAFDTTDTGGASFAHAADSTWHHFALRRSTAGVWTCFVDGTAHELRRKAAGAGPKLTFTKVAIGGSVSTTVAGLKPIVAIDDVCVYGRELTDAEVARLAGKD